MSQRWCPCNWVLTFTKSRIENAESSEKLRYCEIYTHNSTIILIYCLFNDLVYSTTNDNEISMILLIYLSKTTIFFIHHDLHGIAIGRTFSWFALALNTFVIISFEYKSYWRYINRKIYTIVSIASICRIKLSLFHHILQKRNT